MRQQRSRALATVAVPVVVAVVVGLLAWGLIAVLPEGRVAPPPAGPPRADGGDRVDRVEQEPCRRTAEQPGPLVDLGVQASRDDLEPAFLSEEEVAGLVARAEEAGASVVSTSASFYALAPSAGGDYRWTGLDRVLRAADDAGLATRLVLTDMPAWALDADRSQQRGRRTPPLSAAELARWGDYVRTVLEHTDELGVPPAYVEVWPEPNEPGSWDGDPDPVQFARMLRVTRAVVTEVAPATAVITGGLSGNDLGYLDALYDALEQQGPADRPAQTPFDMVGAEPFNLGRSPAGVDPDLVYDREPFGAYDANFTGYTGLRRVMEEHGDEDTEIYLTLFGYSTADDGPTPGISEDLRARYVRVALAQVTCTPYVEALSWYALHPSPFDPASWTLLDAAGRPGPSYAALVQWSQSAPGGPG